MVRDRYEKLRKSARNKALFQFALDNPDKTYEEIGNQFNITKQRVSELFKIEEKRKAAAETTA